jgi:FAD:protein FMN transferase
MAFMDHDAFSARPLQERRFRAMGSDAHLMVVGGGNHLLDNAVRRVEQLERRWSRFIDTSEICELNRRAGEPVNLSADTLLLIERAVEAWRLTGGGFDPTVLGAVVRAGYDVSFDRIAEPHRRLSSALLVGCTDIVLDGSTAQLPAGTGFDPGGVGKGLAADLVVDELMVAGADGACVNLGGDLRVAGISPDGGPWTIAVEHPLLDQPMALIGMYSGAVATSTTLRRRWVVDGQHRHHLIDPATGEPSDSDVELATVIAGQGWMAETFAKAVLLRGSQRAFDIVDESQLQCLIVDSAGRVAATSGFQAFAGATPLPTEVQLPTRNEAGSDP